MSTATTAATAIISSSFVVCFKRLPHSWRQRRCVQRRSLSPMVQKGGGASSWDLCLLSTFQHRLAVNLPPQPSAVTSHIHQMQSPSRVLRGQHWQYCFGFNPIFLFWFLTVLNSFSKCSGHFFFATHSSFKHPLQLLLHNDVFKVCVFFFFVESVPCQLLSLVFCWGFSKTPFQVHSYSRTSKKAEEWNVNTGWKYWQDG